MPPKSSSAFRIAVLTGALLWSSGCSAGIGGPDSAEAAVKVFYGALQDVDFDRACSVISPYQIQQMNTFSGCQPYIATIEPPRGEIVVDPSVITYEDGRAFIPREAVTVDGETAGRTMEALEIDGVWYIELD